MQVALPPITLISVIWRLYKWLRQFKFGQWNKKQSHVIPDILKQNMERNVALWVVITEFQTFYVIIDTNKNFKKLLE